MADNTVSHNQDAPPSESVSVKARIVHNQDAPRSESFNSAAEHLFALTGGANLSNPLNTLEDAGWEENPETKAWYDGTNDELTVGWSYSTDDPRTGDVSGKATVAADALVLYNRALMEIPEGAPVYAGARAKSSSLSNVGFMKAGIEWLDAGLNRITDDNAFTSASLDYVKIGVSAAPPAGGIYARFFLRVDGITANEWYVDDCWMSFAENVPGEILTSDSDLVAHSLVLDGTLTIGNTIEMHGSTSGQVTLVAPPVITNYVLALPDAEPPTGLEFLRGDGTWAIPTDTSYTDEQAQDAVGAMVDASLVYVDATPLLTRAALTGDVTASQGSNATTVANDAVTYAKMQNVSATDKLLGRSTAGAGDVEEIPCTAAGRALIDDVDAAAQRTTLGLDTASTPQFARVGVGAAAGAGGTFVTVNNALDTITTEIGITASASTGNVAGAVYRATADVAQTQFGVWASSRTTSRFGVTIGGYAELIAIAGNGVIYGTFHNAPVIIGVNALARMRFETTGNVKLAGTATRATTEGTNHLDIFNGTAPVGTLTNGVSLYSTAGELRVMDAGGTATLLSSHSKKTGEWIHDSYNTISKKRLVVKIEELCKFIDKKFGTSFVEEVFDELNSDDE